MGHLPLLILTLCPIIANLMIQHIGFNCSPCLLPVAPDIWTASGVYVAGLSLALRDVVQDRYGAAMAMACVIIGAAVSAIISPALAFASAAALLLCEFCDTVVYSLARQRVSRAWAVIASGLVGAVVDGLAFVWLAFGSLELGAGNVIGKLYASLGLAAIWWWRSRK